MSFDSKKPTNDEVINEVIFLHMNRHEQGMKVFKKTMVQNDKPVLEWLNDCREESMDITCYVTKLIRVIEQDETLQKICSKSLTELQELTKKRKVGQSTRETSNCVINDCTHDWGGNE